MAPLKREDFLRKEFLGLDLNRLNVDEQLSLILKQRIEEIEKTIKVGAALATIFLCGSTLEGLLQDQASKSPIKFNKSSAAPKKDGTPLLFHEWKLTDLINSAYEIGLIKLDTKNFSHHLRDFQNYIHPRNQALQNFSPDKHTAEICWKVLQNAITDLSGLR